MPSPIQVTATDADSGLFGSLSYSVGSGIGSVVPTQFSIDKNTGQLCTVQPLDRDEGTSAYDFTITAVDGVSAADANGDAMLLSQHCAGDTIVLAPAVCPTSDLFFSTGWLELHGVCEGFPGGHKRQSASVLPARVCCQH